MTRCSLRFATHMLLCASLFLFACDSDKKSITTKVKETSSLNPETSAPEPPVRPRPSKQTLETVVNNYLTKSFTTQMTIFTYVGNVEIKKATEKSDGGYYLEGEFDYDNALDIRVKRKFRATLKIFLDEYAVEKLEFYTTNMDEWLWIEI